MTLRFIDFKTSEPQNRVSFLIRLVAFQAGGGADT
jgi:hypothetical protein